MLYTETFKYKGQMVTFYNKIKKDPNTNRCWCGFFKGTGYTVQWNCKERKEA